MSIEGESKSSQLIPDLDVGMIAYAKEVIKKKLKDKAPPTFTYKGSSVYEFGTPTGDGYVTLLDETGTVIYFVKHAAVKFSRIKFGRQVLVWRDQNHPSSIGFASHVFFKILLPRFGSLIADQMQTKNGQAFWQFALDKAITDNLYTYFYDRRSTPNRLVSLKSIEDLNRNRLAMWGYTEGHLRTFAVISEQPLAIEVKGRKVPAIN